MWRQVHQTLNVTIRPSYADDRFFAQQATSAACDQRLDVGSFWQYTLMQWALTTFLAFHYFNCLEHLCLLWAALIVSTLTINDWVPCLRSSLLHKIASVQLIQGTEMSWHRCIVVAYTGIYYSSTSWNTELHFCRITCQACFESTSKPSGLGSLSCLGQSVYQRHFHIAVEFNY